MRSVLKDYAGVILLSLIAVAGFTGIGWMIERENPAPAVRGIMATPSMTEAERAAPDLIVDVPWLTTQLENDGVPLVLDASAEAVYNEGHIPGAVHVWWQDFMRLHTANYGEPLRLNPTDETRNDRLEPKAFDIDPTTGIVIYDADGNGHAAWLVFVLRTNGYTNVRVLDGGLAAWIGAGNELETTSRSLPTIGRSVPNWVRANVIETDELASRLTDPALAIVDVRTPEQQQDTVNETVSLGQIPGTRRLDPAVFLNDDGTFASPDRVNAAISALGISPDQEIVIYGLFSSDTGNAWIGFHRAGFHRVRVYEHGYVQWGAGDQHPLDPLGAPAPTPTPTPTPPP